MLPREATGTDAPTLWRTRAERLAEQVLDEVKSGIDAFPSVSALEAVLRIEAGELPADEMDGYHFPSEEPDPAGCICPPDLAARGGFRGGCPVHASIYLAATG